MPFEFWGATEIPDILMPQRTGFGYALLALYVAFLLYILYRERHSFARLTRRQWLAVGLLALLGFFSQFLAQAFAFDDQLSPPASVQNPQLIFVPFGAVAFLLTGALFNPAAALLVGVLSGFGHMLWSTGQIFTVFHFAFAGLWAGRWLSQRYRGRLYRWLRWPPVSGALAMVALIPLVGLAAYAYAEPTVGALVVLDWVISLAGAHLFPYFLEGLFGGAIVALILWGVPQWRPQPTTLRPAPENLSVRTRLLHNFAVFAVLLSAALLAVVFTLSVRLATQLAVNQMAHNALTVTQQIPDFRNQVQNLLSQYGNDPVFLEDDAELAREHLGQLSRTAGTFYRRVILVNTQGEVTAFYPYRDKDEIDLTRQEREAVTDALARGAPTVTAAQTVEGREHVLSFIVPVLDDAGRPQSALIGRIPGIALSDLVVGLRGTVGEGSGFIVDERGRVIADPDENSLFSPWSPPADGRSVRARVQAPGTAFEGRDSETNARELVYYVQGPDHPWTVVIAVPYQVVLRLALQISGPLVVVLIIGMLLFGLNLVVLGKSITTPLQRLVTASQDLADGQWNVAVPYEEEDEVGQLGQAFEQMRRSMQRQFNEIRLMLDVSQDISTSLDIQQGVPTVLRGALRGTGAAGARTVVLNPSGRHPLMFAEGPAGEEMAALDRKVSVLAQGRQEVTLNTAEQIRAQLELPDSQSLPVRSIWAIALHAKNRFQGVLWIGYRQPHHFTDTELGLLRSLAGQAAVLIENARLYATAEGQRRRLAAVLASTSDAVIVTDQTERILLINRAMEETFGLKGPEVVGRPVAGVIHNPNLVKALTEQEERVRNLEVPTEDNRILYASVSTIISTERHVLGRVAVLHDITHLKELDQMKSEFVSTVSHDLRGPLTFMRGYITMLPMVGEVNKKQEDYIDKILNGVQQMSTLVEDLLDLGRIEAGVELVQHPIEPGHLLTNVAHEQKEQAAVHGLEIQVKIAPDLPVFYGDYSLIQRALANLISNAIKYAPNSGTVTLQAIREDSELIFSVQDQGPGISKQDQIRLFEKFYRVPEKKDSGRKGSGLGLAIVKSIVERHGGRVWVHSQPGRGSTFYFSLPLHREKYPNGQNSA